MGLDRSVQVQAKNMREDEILGLVSWPMTVRKPPNESSSGSRGFSFVRTPTSIFEGASNFVKFTFQVPDAEGCCWNVFSTSACDIES